MAVDAIVIVIGTVIVAVHVHGNDTVIVIGVAVDVIVIVIVIGTVIVAVHVHGNDTVIVILPVDSDLRSPISDLRSRSVDSKVGPTALRCVDASQKIVKGTRSRPR